MSFYGFGETIRNVADLLYTKMAWKGARLVRRPFFARNKKSISISEGFTTGRYCRVTAGEDNKIIFGTNFVMGDMCQLEGMGGITIGQNVLLASKIFIGTSSHGEYSGEVQSSAFTAPNDRDIVNRKIEIGDNVWVGNGVTILSGVKVGNGVIIGAGSVVTKDVPDNCMVAGIPAKIIKRYNCETEKWERNL